MGAKNICIWNPATCSCENGKYVESIIDNSVVMCDGIMEETKTIPIKTTAKKNHFNKFLNFTSRFINDHSYYLFLLFIFIKISIKRITSITISLHH